MRRAFTLIELLLVISVIAILASIIFPALASAKESGYAGKALVQAQQLGSALQMYAEASDGELLPSTNYGLKKADPNRIWTPALLPFVKSEEIFVAPNSKGAFPHSWAERGVASFGYSSATAVDQINGCKDDRKDTTGCLAFKEAASFDKSDLPAQIAVLASTANGDTKSRYRGYEFSPYNGVPNSTDIHLSPPLVSDRDLVAELKTMPGDLLKPIFARYNSTGHDQGQTPIVFADGHCKSYTVKQILAGSGIIWRFR